MRFANFAVDIRVTGRKLSPPKLNAQKKKVWDVRQGVRKIEAMVEKFGKFEGLSKIIKSHYNECRSHQSFDNTTPAEVRIAATSDKQEYSPQRTGEMECFLSLYTK